MRKIMNAERAYVAKGMLFCLCIAAVFAGCVSNGKAAVKSNPYENLKVIGTWELTGSSIKNDMIDGLMGMRKEWKSDVTSVHTEGGEQTVQYYVWTDKYFVALEGDIAIVWTYKFIDNDTLETTLVSESMTGVYDKEKYLSSLPGTSSMEGEAAIFTWKRIK